MDNPTFIWKQNHRLRIFSRHVVNKIIH